MPKPKTTNKIILQKYVNEVVNESVLKAAFVDPLVDIFKTAAYGIKDLSIRTQTLFKIVIKGFSTLAIPLLDYDYSHFKQEEKEKLDKLKEKYSDVLAKNDDAFYNSDLYGIAFFLEPQKMLGAKLAKLAPAAALNILDILTGGTSKTITNMRQRYSELTSPPESTRHSSSGGGSSDSGGYGGGYGGDDGGPYGASIDYGGGDYGDYGGIYEQSFEAPKMPKLSPDQQVKQRIAGLLNNKQFVNKLLTSPMVKNMRTDAINIIVNRVSAAMKIKTFDELKSKYGQFANKLDNLIKTQDQKIQAPPEEIETMKQAIVSAFKEEYKVYYIAKLQQLLASDPTLNPIISHAVQQIKNMK